MALSFSSTMDTVVAAILPGINDKLLWPAVVTMLACLLALALLRLLIHLALEPGEAVRPSLHYRPSLLSKRLIGTLPALRATYTVPSCWSLLAGSSRAALVMAVTAASQACAKWTGQVRFLREYLLLNDDELVSLDWALTPERPYHLLTSNHVNERRNESASRHGWIVLLIPGHWVYDSKKHLQSVCRSLADEGHQPVVWNRRGKAGTPLIGSSSSSASVCGDLRQVIQYLSAQNPNSPLALVGFSHAASLLISYLGEFGSSSLIHSAIAVSPLWQRPPAALDWILSACKGIRPDTRLLDPLRDSDDIAVPLLVVHYDDDPLVPACTLPRELFSLYPQLMLVTCPLGGHCGQLQYKPLAEVIVSGFIREVLGFTSWSSSIAKHLQQTQQQQTGRRNRVRSLTRSSTARKPRKHHLKNGRPSCSSC